MTIIINVPVSSLRNSEIKTRKFRSYIRIYVHSDLWLEMRKSLTNAQ